MKKYRRVPRQWLTAIFTTVLNGKRRTSGSVYGFRSNTETDAAYDIDRLLDQYGLELYVETKQA